MLLDPRDRARDPLSGGSGRHDLPEARALRTSEHSVGDLPNEERSQDRYVPGRVEERDESGDRIEKRWFDRRDDEAARRLVGRIASRPLGYQLPDDDRIESNAQTE